MNSPEVDLAYGLLGIILHRFRNPDKTYLNWISVLLLGLFLSQYIFYFFHLAGQIVWVVSTLGLTVFYSLRFKSKTHKTLADYLKPIGLLLLIIFPWPFYSFTTIDDNIFWTVLRLSTYTIVGMIFVYDRWILKPELMKKKFIIALVTQSVMILLLLMYAFVQKSEADKQHYKAEEQRLQSEKNADDVIRLQDKLDSMQSL